MKNKIYFNSAQSNLVPHEIQESYFNFIKNGEVLSDIQVDEVRQKIQSFFGLNSKEEVVFTAGATYSMNTIIYSWMQGNIADGDELLFSLDDHDSFVLPIRYFIKKKKEAGKKIVEKNFKYKKNGEIDIDELISKITPSTKVVFVTMIHNIYGNYNDEISKIKQKFPDVKLIIDITQAVGHVKMNLAEMKYDFAFFSSHKFLAPKGLGILLVNSLNFGSLSPFLIGSKMVHSHSNDIVFKSMPQLLEAGTINDSLVFAIGQVVDFIINTGEDEIYTKTKELTRYLLEKMSKLEQLIFLPGMYYCNTYSGYGIVSFRHKKSSITEIGQYLESNNIFVRFGKHCVHDGNNLSDSIRISLHYYNSFEEIDYFIDLLSEFE